MASSKEYLDYVLDQLSLLDGITARAMMGEFLIYYHATLVGGVYDERFLVKNTPAARRLMPQAAEETPYPGAKAMLLVDDPDDRELLAQLIPAVAAELPASKRR